MKVYELAEHLKEYNQDATVLLDTDGFYPLTHSTFEPVTGANGIVFLHSTAYMKEHNRGE